MNTKKLAIQAGLMLSVISSALAHADANDYVHTPVVEYGEREIDYKSGAEHNRDGGSDAANSLGYGFTPTSWWFAELYAKYQRPAGEKSGFDAWELENSFQLTETGKYPLDVGFLLEIERPKDRADGYELTYGPMFQTEWGMYQGNFNFFIQKHVRNTAAADTELHYQLQLKYRHSEQLEWGVQAFGNAGQWNDWKSSAQQEFKIGPALFGRIRVGSKQSIMWNTAVLAGTTNATPSTTLRLQAEYEF